MFITFEGIEGSGKSTVIKMVQDWLEHSGFSVLITREPGGTSIGEDIRAILLNAENVHLAAEAELFLYMADRAQHVKQVLLPAINSDKIILCDRYTDSTIAYQGFGRGLDLDRLFLLNNIAVQGVWPQLTLLLDLDAEKGLSRAKNRNQSQHIENKEGRFEAEDLIFHQKIRAGYLDLAKKYSDRYVIINAELSLLDVFEQTKYAINAKMADIK